MRPLTGSVESHRERNLLRHAARYKPDTNEVGSDYVDSPPVTIVWGATPLGELMGSCGIPNGVAAEET